MALAERPRPHDGRAPLRDADAVRHELLRLRDPATDDALLGTESDPGPWWVFRTIVCGRPDADRRPALDPALKKRLLDLAARTAPRRTLGSTRDSTRDPSTPEETFTRYCIRSMLMSEDVPGAFHASALLVSQDPSVLHKVLVNAKELGHSDMLRAYVNLAVMSGLEIVWAQEQARRDHSRR